MKHDVFFQAYGHTQNQTSIVSSLLFFHLENN